MSAAPATCPHCGSPAVASDAFCEHCGAQLRDDAAAALEEPNGGVPSESHGPRTTTSDAPGAPGDCAECGGEVLDDGFCSVCGKKALSERDHWQEAPVPWIGGVCDKGIAHARNEDAMALAGLSDRSLGVMVVCDGVTSAPDSDRAALVAARDACATLVASPPPSGDSMAARIAHWSAAMVRAASDANAAVVAVARSLGDPAEPPSCTFVAAAVDDEVVTVAWCGDSRAYWLPDDGDALQLMTDHSLGTELIRAGKTREEAEQDPVFHTITRWLGADSADATPEVSFHQLDSPGWLLVCSDGLWNYASPPAALHELVSGFVAAGHDSPLAIADLLVRFANDQGGHDNITATLARCAPSLR